jgi:hypothetical protein
MTLVCCTALASSGNGGRRAVLSSDKNLEASRADPHQVISIMATTICDAHKDHSSRGVKKRSLR